MEARNPLRILQPMYQELLNAIIELQLQVDKLTEELANKNEVIEMQKRELQQQVDLKREFDPILTTPNAPIYPVITKEET